MREHGNLPALGTMEGSRRKGKGSWDATRKGMGTKPSGIAAGAGAGGGGGTMPMSTTAGAAAGAGGGGAKPMPISTIAGAAAGAGGGGGTAAGGMGMAPMYAALFFASMIHSAAMSSTSLRHWTDWRWLMMMSLAALKTRFTLQRPWRARTARALNLMTPVS